MFPRSGLTIKGQPASGNLWVELPRATYSMVQGGKKLVIDQKKLARSDAQFFTRYFKDKSNAAQIPWILGPASLIPVVGAAITIATSTIDGLMRITEPPVNSDQLSILMAAGGSFLRTIAEEEPTHLTSSILYTAKVANEVRIYGICSATYGLNLV
jgi:hypothetical protein